MIFAYDLKDSTLDSIRNESSSFKITTTLFSANKIQKGHKLTPSECIITADLKGNIELHMVHPLDSDNAWKYIIPECCIDVPSFDVTVHNSIDVSVPTRLTNQRMIFRIYKTSFHDGNVEAWGKHVAIYDLSAFYTVSSKNKLAEYGFENITINDLLTGDDEKVKAKITDRKSFYPNGIQVDGYVNRQIGDNPYVLYAPEAKVSLAEINEGYNIADLMIGSREDSIVNSTEFSEVNYCDSTHFIPTRYGCGGDYGQVISVKKNAVGMTYDIDYSGLCTLIVPRCYNNRVRIDESYDLYDNCKSDHFKDYAMPYVQIKEYSNIKMAEDADEDDNPDDVYTSESTCKTRLIQEVEKDFAMSKCDIPEVTLRVDIADIANSDDYKELGILEKDISLGDTVKAFYEEIGLQVEQRVVELTYDCILRRNQALTLGTKQNETSVSFPKKISNRADKIEERLTEAERATWERVSVVTGKGVNTHSSDPLRITKKGDQVFVQGKLSTVAGSFDGSNTIQFATLAPAYRPKSTRYFIIPIGTSGIARASITSSGVFSLDWTRRLSDGTAISATTSWFLDLSCSYFTS